MARARRNQKAGKQKLTELTRRVEAAPVEPQCSSTQRNPVAVSCQPDEAGDHPSAIYDKSVRD